MTLGLEKIKNTNSYLAQQLFCDLYEPNLQCGWIFCFYPYILKSQLKNSEIISKSHGDYYFLKYTCLSASFTLLDQKS